jgi:hypothetical protein
LAEGLVRLGTWMPFEQAAEHLAFGWDVRISEATARRHTQAAGAAHVAVQTAEVERLERALPSPPAGPAVQQLSADGAMVPLLRGAWGEVKTLAIGTVAVEPAAQATFGPGTAATAAWLEAQADALKHGAPSAVLVALQALPTPRAAHPATADQVRKGAFRYLEKRLDQLRYAEYLAAGYPIGSGAVESANKLVVEARLKGSGMHWAPAHVNPLLALRTIACADRWAEAWPAICGQLRRQAWAARAARRRARRLPPLPPVTPAALPRPKLPRPASPPVRPPLVVNRRPTAAHPWKRRPFLLGVRHHANPGAKL